MERIFLIFQRLHKRSEYEGTGFGLAIAKKIVDRHGGGFGLSLSRELVRQFFFTIPSDLSDVRTQLLSEPKAYKDRIKQRRIALTDYEAVG